MKKTAESAGGIVNFVKQYEDWLNLMFGLLTLVVLVAGGFWLVKSRFLSPASPTSQLNQTVEEAQTQTPQVKPNQPRVYVVQAGDYLWKIAKEQYGDGFAWVKIAQANQITQPDLIYKGQKLILPEIEAAKVLEVGQTQSNTPQTEVIEYTVKKGDMLWWLSQRFYQNPYLYLQVAKYNNLADPNLIEVGQVIKFPPKTVLVQDQG